MSQNDHWTKNERQVFFFSDLILIWLDFYSQYFFQKFVWGSKMYNISHKYNNLHVNTEASVEPKLVPSFPLTKAVSREEEEERGSCLMTYYSSLISACVFSYFGFPLFGAECVLPPSSPYLSFFYFECDCSVKWSEIWGDFYLCPALQTVPCAFF